MCKWYKEMECYLLIPEQPTERFRTDKIAQRAKLEQSFRNYAAVFDNLKIVINSSQAKEHYLNFPYICYSQKTNTTIDLNRLLEDATSEAIFIGHTDMGDFPLSLLTNLLKSYNGELFMGYKSDNQQSHQLQLGIYHKSIMSKTSGTINLDTLDKNLYKLLPLPESAESYL